MILTDAALRERAYRWCGANQTTYSEWTIDELTKVFIAIHDAARADAANPKSCQDCEGADCERCGGTGFYCVGCPTYGRAADMWEALLKTARAEQREALESAGVLFAEIAECSNTTVEHLKALARNGIANVAATLRSQR